MAWRAWAGQNDNAMLREAMAEPWAQGGIETVEGPHRGRLIAAVTEEPRFADWVKSRSPAIVHRTYHAIRDQVGSSFPQVETLHDLWDERSSLLTDRGAPLRSFIKRRACQRADAIVCVSEHTRDEAVSRWPFLSHKMTIIPHGVRPLSLRPIAPKIDGPYFLFVGRRGFYKNFMTVAEALHCSGLDQKLICFGGGPFSERERSELASLNLLDQTEQVAGTDDHLAGLYMHATALLYPSSFEGFGLPLLEAMVHDCPVISSPLTSLPEVGGDAVLYAEPDRPDAWIDAMQRVTADSALAEDLRRRGRARAAQFTWSRSAERHAQLYRSLTG